MRKKELLNLNSELFEDAKKYKALYEELKKENAILLDRIDALQKEIGQLTSVTAETSEPETASDGNAELQNNNLVSEEMHYASAVIGKLIIKADIGCSMLKCGGDTETASEKINLILGETEVVKSKIFNAVSSDIPFDSKKEQIDAYKLSLENYIDSIINTKN